MNSKCGDDSRLDCIVSDIIQIIHKFGVIALASTPAKAETAFCKLLSVQRHYALHAFPLEVLGLSLGALSGAIMAPSDASPQPSCEVKNRRGLYNFTMPRTEIALRYVNGFGMKNALPSRRNPHGEGKMVGNHSIIEEKAIVLSYGPIFEWIFEQ